MARLMSVSLTEAAVLDRSKTVTRRMGWLMLKPGDQLTLCRKVMGRRKGEPLVRLVDVEVLSVRREPLDSVTAEDVAREGFPDMTPGEFLEFFCASHKGCKISSEVTRIEWRYLDPEWCPLSERVDGKKHSWVFDGDNPYIICCYCNEMRDALDGRVVRPGATDG